MTFASLRSESLPVSAIPCTSEWWDIPGRLADIPAQGNVAILCHAGVRSQHVCDYLTNRGIDGTYSVVGGIDRWSTDVDPDIPRY